MTDGDVMMVSVKEAVPRSPSAGQRYSVVDMGTGATSAVPDDTAAAPDDTPDAALCERARSLPKASLPPLHRTPPCSQRLLPGDGRPPCSLCLERVAWCPCCCWCGRGGRTHTRDGHTRDGHHTRGVDRIRACCELKLVRWQCISCWLVASYLVVALVLFLAAPMLIYPAAFFGSWEPSIAGNRSEFAFASRSSGARLTGARLQAGSGPQPVAVIFFGGNGEGMWSGVEHGRDLVSDPASLRKYAFDIVSFDYMRQLPRPWGRGEEATMVDDALGLWDHTRRQAPDRPVILGGFSMGTAVAAAVAATVSADGGGGGGAGRFCTALMAPFTAMRAEARFATKHLGSPWIYVLGDAWRTKRHVASARQAPLAVFSCDDDFTIPAWMHEKVHAAGDPGRSRIARKSGCMHMDTPGIAREAWAAASAVGNPNATFVDWCLARLLRSVV